MVIPARTRLLASFGTLGDRCLWRRLVLYHQPRLLLAQRVLSWHQYSIAKAYGVFPGAPQLRYQASTLGVVLRQFLAERSNKPEWRGEFKHAGNKFSSRSNDFSSRPKDDSPVFEIQLQRPCVRPIRRRLSDRFRRMAILLAGST